jgi:ankyrin repeat protein
MGSARCGAEKRQSSGLCGCGKRGRCRREPSRLLVDLRADVNVWDNSGETVLHSAAEGGNEAVVRLLVDKGADVKAKDKCQ